MTRDEQTIAIVSFTGAIKREMVKVKQKLAAAAEHVDNLTEFEVNITASGRTASGDIKIEFAVSDSRYGGAKVEGNNLDECLTEFLRRKGWAKVNQPLMLTSGEQNQANPDRIA